VSDGVHPGVVVRSRAVRASRAGHPWVFRDDVVHADDVVAGDVVRVSVERGPAIDWAFWSTTSKIALRRLGLDPAVAPDESTWSGRIHESCRRRLGSVPDAGACRLVFGESDGLPGFVADRYASHLVVQALTAAVDQRLERWAGTLIEESGGESVLARNDSAVRELEGLRRVTIQVVGTTPERIEIQEGPLRLSIDPWQGQKTGSFLDQRQNRIELGGASRGRVLDVFCYQGHFSLHAAAAGAEVVAVDSSAPALAVARQNAELNGLQVDWIEANAFDELRGRAARGERFDRVVLDPPALAKNRRDLPAALRAYKELNLRAMRLLGPDGILVSCSCSYHLSEEAMLDVLARAAVDSDREFRLVERRSQGSDHPIRLGFPESRYLKCYVLQAN
jgi:23S rRNA (cytosine1962-C5)-methyltransferase